MVVVGVPDGDTIKVLVADHQLLRVRLAYCDAPEKRQAFGPRAKGTMSELAFGKEVELRPYSIDRNGRTVADTRGGCCTFDTVGKKQRDHFHLHQSFSRTSVT